MQFGTHIDAWTNAFASSDQNGPEVLSRQLYPNFRLGQASSTEPSLSSGTAAVVRCNGDLWVYRS